MCLLTFLRPGVQPNIRHLENGACDNNDGHGFAIVADGQLVTHRGLVAREVIDAFADARAMLPNGPALFHSRYGTGGTVSVDNCHPYQVGQDRLTVLAHNGVMFHTSDARSDTRVFAEDMVPRVGFRTARQRKALAKHIRPGNRVVILTANPRYKLSAYLFNEREGIWQGGIWYSNNGYMENMGRYACTAEERDAILCGRPLPKLARESTFDDMATCVVCEARGTVDWIDYICDCCGACQECAGIGEECECDGPPPVTRRYGESVCDDCWRLGEWECDHQMPMVFRPGAGTRK